MTFRCEGPPAPEPKDSPNDLSIECISGTHEGESQRTTSGTADPPSERCTEEDLEGLTPNELRKIILNLRVDLYRTKAELGNYEQLISALPEKRDLLVR